MTINGFLIAFVFFVTVSQINAKSYIENGKAVESNLKPGRQRRLLNSLIDMFAASPEYNVTIYIIKDKQSEDFNKNNDNSFVNVYEKFNDINYQSRKSVFMDNTEKKKNLGDSRTVLDLLNRELNKRILKMGVGRSKIPRED